MMRIESLLSARLFMAPQLVSGRIYFVSDMSGRLSLYAMTAQPGGSVPLPLLPPHIALQNPHLIGGLPYYVFPALGKILIMLDNNGDENYQPMLIPLDGGYPEPAFGDTLANTRCHVTRCDAEHNLIYLVAESRSEAMNTSYVANLATGELHELMRSMWGAYPEAANESREKIVLSEGYTAGDIVLYLWDKGNVSLLYGTPREKRKEGEPVVLSAIFHPQFVPGDRGLLFATALFDDAYGLGYLPLAGKADVRPVTIRGVHHHGVGELVSFEHLDGDRYAVGYNIDGVSWLYEGEFDERSLTMTLDHVICGQGAIANGVLESSYYDKATKTHSLSYSTATSPTQIYTVAGGKGRRGRRKHTGERVLGVAPDLLAAGEDAAFTSHDGLRISARLYMPAASLGFTGKRPLVYYVHGGPQSQERPDFAWFSMPLIQFLTLNGFAVFVPNARGSSGYGLSYMKRVDRDWGGQDRLDHVHAMTRVLPQDARLDVTRAGVVGRSYGGYMTLTLAARHPALWKAAVDMFGPYDLRSFMERIPETWKPYFKIAVGDPEKDKDLLIERSPATYMDSIACPLLVIQGRNDPRVAEPESRDVVERLRSAGKDVDYLVFEDEGHDVLKFPNKVRCYNAITAFFKQHLQPREGFA